MFSRYKYRATPKKAPSTGNSEPWQWDKRKLAPWQLEVIAKMGYPKAEVFHDHILKSCTLRWLQNNLDSKAYKVKGMKEIVRDYWVDSGFNGSQIRFKEESDLNLFLMFFYDVFERV